MHVCLPTPPTSKPQMPEGQTSRRSAPLLEVPVAGTVLSGGGSGAAPSDELILTPISVTFKGLSHRVRSAFIYARGQRYCQKRNAVSHTMGASSRAPEEGSAEYKLFMFSLEDKETYQWK